MSRRWRWGLFGIAVAAVIAAFIGLAWPDKPDERERMAAAIEAFTQARNRMTPEEVQRSFGEPDEVSRNNPRALCWAYHEPYKVRMCWGPKRRAAWISYSVPRDGADLFGNGPP